MNFVYIKNTAVNTVNGPLQQVRLITEITSEELNLLQPNDVLSAQAVAPLLAAGENTALLSLIAALQTGKKDKEGSKVLSTNDYTTAEKTKLTGIATGATNVVVSDTFTNTSAVQALSAAKGKQLNDLLATAIANITALTARVAALEVPKP